METTVINRKIKLVATCVLIAIMAFAGTFGVAVSSSAAEEDVADVMEMLNQELKLNPEQSKQLSAKIQQFVDTLDRLKTDQEKEDADPDALIKGAKKAQEEYLTSVKKILTTEQFNQYTALKEKTVKGMFRDLAEIQLMDLQPKVGFSDEQLTQLVPVLGDTLFQVITLAWEHAGKRLRIGQKIRLAKQLKKIQKDSHTAVSKVLTPEQLKTWDQIKAQAKQQKKSKP